MKTCTRPTSLLIVCGLLALWGLLAFYKSAVLGKITLHGSQYDFGVLALVASPLLLVLTRIGRWMAIMLTYYWIIGSVLWALELFPLPVVTVTSHGDTPDILPIMLQRILVWPFLAIQIWELSVLKRPAIRSLFYLQPPVTGQSDMTASNHPQSDTLT
jgi:hypothetical protein